MDVLGGGDGGDGGAVRVWCGAGWWVGVSVAGWMGWRVVGWADERGVDGWSGWVNGWVG